MFCGGMSPGLVTPDQALVSKPPQKTVKNIPIKVGTHYSETGSFRN